MPWRSILAAAVLSLSMPSCTPSRHGAQAVPTVTIALPNSQSFSAEPAPLLPIRLAAQEPREFTRWKLTNDSQDVIRPVGWAGWYVHLESRAPDGWVAAPISYCATVAPYIDPLLPGRSIEVVTLCPIDREILPAGNYRAVIDYIEDFRGAGAGAGSNNPAPRAAPTLQSRLATAEFEVVGLAVEESFLFVRALSSDDVRECLDSTSLGNYVEAFTWIGHRSALPRLLDVPAKSYDEYLVLARAITGLPEAGRLLLNAQAERSGDASVAAGVALYTSRICALSEESCREVAERWTRQLDAADPPIAIVNALGERPSYWPPALPGVLLKHLRTTKSVKVLAPLAHALEVMPDEALASTGRPAVLELRRRAHGRVDPDTRVALLDVADRLAVRTGMQQAPEFGKGGFGLSGLPELGGSSGPCDAVYRRLEGMLRLKGPEELSIRHGESRDEPGPWVPSEKLFWLR